MTPREKLENDILTAFKCACEQNRLDVADLMLAALEELDRDRQEPRMGRIGGSMCGRR
jgi:hypothetical protein